MTDSRPIYVLALLALGAWLIYLLTPILTPFLVSALLAYLGNPAVRQLERWRFPRPLAVIQVFLLFVLFILILLLFLIPAVERQIMNFAGKAPIYIDWLQYTVLPWLQNVLGIKLTTDVEALRKMLLGHWREVSDWTSAAFVTITRSGLNIIGWFVSLLLIPVVTFYLLLDWEKLPARLLTLVPPRQQEKTVALARETDEVLGSFLRGQLLVMLALATIYSVGLTLLGLNLALPIGILSGLVSFVPYLGFITGITAAGIAAYVEFQNATMLLGVAGIFLIGQVLESFWLTPRLVGDRIGLHPVTVIFAVMAGGQLFGFTGILLALPLAAVLKVWLRHVRDYYVERSEHPPAKRRRRPPAKSA